MSTLTIYPDAGDPGTTSCDGRVSRFVANLTWANLVGATGNLKTQTLTTSGFAYTESLGGNQYNRMDRSIFIGDKSAIPGGSTITAVVQSLAGFALVDTDGVSPDVNVYGAATGSDVALVNGDYQVCGTTPYCDTPIAYSSWVIGAAYNDFAYNAAGLAACSGSIIKTSARNANYEVALVNPNMSNGASFGFYAYMSDFGSNKPKWVITYTLPPAGYRSLGGGVSSSNYQSY